MARFNSSKLRAAVSRFNSAVNRYNSAVRTYNSRLRSAVADHNRRVRKLNDLLRELQSRRYTTIVVYRAEWYEMTVEEQRHLEREAQLRNVDIELRGDADDEPSDVD